MDVILLTKVANLGTIGDRVKVKSGWSDDERALRSLGYDDV
jgi:ribosomal protein L9